MLVLEKNSALKTIRKIAEVTEGEEKTLPEGMEPADMAELKFCPVAAVDFKKSFSMFKNAFSNHRHNFTEENLTKVMISTCCLQAKNMRCIAINFAFSEGIALNIFSNISNIP